MPRETVKLSPAQEPPPAWWQAEWYARQAEIRTRIVAGLGRITYPMTASQAQQNLMCSSVYRAREVRHALDVLVGEGMLRRFERTEAALCGSGTMTRTHIYYELTEATHASPEPIQG